LFENVSNVIAAERSKFESVFEGASDFVGAIDFTQSHDFGDVNPGIEATILKLAIILLAKRAESVKAQEQFGVAGLASLLEQILDVIWVFEVPVPIVATGVAGDELLVMINAEPIGEGFEHQSLGSIEAWHRIAIGIKHDTETIVSAHGGGDSGVCWNRW
jgi:hypothetical protein